MFIIYHKFRRFEWVAFTVKFQSNAKRRNDKLDGYSIQRFKFSWFDVCFLVVRVLHWAFDK